MRLQRAHGVALAAAVAIAPTLAFAQQQQQAVDNDTVLSLSASFTVSAKPNRLLAVLHTAASGNTPAAVSAAINQAMAEVKRSATRYPTVRLEAGEYSLDPGTAPAPRWEGQQQVMLFSTDDSDNVLQVVGVLQMHDFVTDSLAWTLSTDDAAGLRQQAIERALGRLKQQAQSYAQALGMHFVRLRSVSVDEDASFTPMRAMIAARSLAPTVDQPQAAHVSATVHGEALLSQP